MHRAFGNAHTERFSLPFFFNPDPTSIVAPLPGVLKDGEEVMFEPQDVGRRTVKGIMTNRPGHPFLKALKELGLKEEALDYGLVTRSIDDIAAEQQA